MEQHRKVELTESISQLLELPPASCNTMADELASVDIPYKTVYDSFQSGGWYTAVLYTASQSEKGGMVCDGHAQATELASRLPLTKTFIESLGLDLFTVRVAKMDAEACLWEHRDYIELEENRQRFRLHVPLITTPDAAIHFPGWRIHMSSGWIWKLDPTISHGGLNAGPAPRTHLILDCYVNDTLRALLDGERLDDQHMERKPLLQPDVRRQMLETAQALIVQGGTAKAERTILDLFFQFDLRRETGYDLLVELYYNLGFKSREIYWIGEKITRLYDREKLEPATSEPYNIIISKPYSSSSQLPQVAILEQILVTFRTYPGLEKAYVRGSLARGCADPLSDIDLLCEVLPQNFASFIERANADLPRHHHALARGIVDDVVKDFGGVGFIFLLQYAGRIYQLDLYVSCLGRPWGSGTYKREIFRRLRKSADYPDYECLLHRMHAAQIEKQIRSIQNVDPSVGQTLLELNVLSVMLKKCLDRGDEFVASSEYDMWKICFVKLVRQKFDVQYRDYGFYHLKRLATEVGDGGILFDDLREIFKSPLTSQGFAQIHHYAVGFAWKHFAHDCARYKTLLEAVSSHISDFHRKHLDSGLRLKAL